MGRPKASYLKSIYHNDMIQLRFDTPEIDTLRFIYSTSICNNRIKTDSWKSGKKAKHWQYDQIRLNLE